MHWGRCNALARGKSRRKRGMALVTALIATFVAATMITVMMTISMASNDKAQVGRHSVQARYLGEGAVEFAKKELQTAIANWDPVPAAGQTTVGGQQVQYTVVPTGMDQIATDSAGIQTIITGYEIEARGISQGSQEPVHRIINTEATPIFQFAVFYTEDLEINPGPNMTLGGRVHTNQDMYLGSNNTLTVDTNYLRAVGGIYRHRKDNPGVSQGTVDIRKWVENPYDPSEPSEFVTMYSESQLAGQGVTSTSGYDSNFMGLDLNADDDFTGAGEWLPWGPGALDFWQQPDAYGNGYGNTVLSEEHGIGEAVAPHIGSIAMYEEVDGGDYEWDGTTQQYMQVAAGSGTHSPGFFHENADLSIITYDDGSWDAFDADGFSVKASLVGIVTQGDLHDARQSNNGDDTPVCEIDIDALNTSGVFPANGLLYAAHYGMGEGTDAKGVLLTNGAELAGALSVVSEGPVYVQGDYNTVDKKGAAVIGDAVNLLSNSWTGTKTAGTLPSASDTSFNMAIVTGNHETQVGGYNGGLENLPRFHESWSGKKCKITGSFVNTWESKFATGTWKYGGDRYKAPARIWTYDEAFNRVANLPPFTPMAVTATDVVMW